MENINCIEDIYISITTLICDYFDVTEEELLKHCNLHLYTKPRQVWHYLLRKYTHWSYKQIGIRADRHHATIMNNYKLITGMIESQIMENQIIHCERIIKKIDILLN